MNYPLTHCELKLPTTHSTHRSLHAPPDPRPAAVHATYSLDRHDGLAKRQRFRESGLWRSDPDEYFQGKYLALNASVSPAVQAAIAAFAARRPSVGPGNIGVHSLALATHLAELRDGLARAPHARRPTLGGCRRSAAPRPPGTGAGRSSPPSAPLCCSEHVPRIAPREAAAAAAQAAASADICAACSPPPPPRLARALKRTLVLPRWLCYCDRLWSPSDDIFHFGCMYPGAQDGNFLPFVCPMDHVLSPTEWQQVGQPYRDASWLGRALTPALTLALTLGLTLALTLSRRASRTETRPSSTACPAAALPRWLSSTTRPATRPAPPPSAPLA